MQFFIEEFIKLKLQIKEIKFSVFYLDSAGLVGKLKT
jgi:hypothetical protein